MPPINLSRHQCPHLADLLIFINSNLYSSPVLELENTFDWHHLLNGQYILHLWLFFERPNSEALLVSLLKYSIYAVHLTSVLKNITF